MAVRIILLAALAWGISGGILNGNESQDFKIGTENKSLEPGWLNDRPTVDIPQGRVVGTVETAIDGSNFEYFAYRGIPYAKPPLHELRFMPPVPADAWEGDLDASEDPHKCIQLFVEGREDCLYLDVATPT
ncbi:unnamed protein product, partial [Meganyctiphanes norvegica]